MPWSKARSIDDVRVGDPVGYPFDVGIWKHDGVVSKVNHITENVYVEVPTQGTSVLTMTFHWSLIHVKVYRKP